MHFITNGNKHFSKTTSIDPWQRVPLTVGYSVFQDAMRYFTKAVVPLANVIGVRCRAIPLKYTTSEQRANPYKNALKSKSVQFLFYENWYMILYCYY